MAALNIGVIIGRFQVPELHEGHRRMFAEVAKDSDRIVVLLGVSPVDGYTAENPLTFSQRQSMVRHSVVLESWMDTAAELTIMPLFDQRTNEEWSQQLDTLLKGTYPLDYITLYGGRGSFTESYTGKLKVKKSTFCPVIAATGAENRAAIKEANTPDFYAGQIYALQRQFPRAFPTVDVAMLRTAGTPPETQVLLIQRADSGEWCFPGGFVDPTDDSFELAAKRELFEETGMGTESPLEYVGTYRINDFRYRASRDKIITTFFVCNYSFGVVVVNPTEVQDYKWFGADGALDIVSVVHRPLLCALRARLLRSHVTSEELCRSLLEL